MQFVKGMQEVVPGWLAAACPALHSLRLAVCTVRAGEDMQSQHKRQGQVAAAFPFQLQSLCLRWGIVEQQLLAETLASLPSLTSLDVTLLYSNTDSRVDMSSVLSALAGQLTQLVWYHECAVRQLRLDEPVVPSLLTSPAILCKLSKLQWLDMMGITLDDAGLRVLLKNLPTLTHVGVRKLVLHESHADVGCSWEELNMCTVTVTSLAHLPLRGIKRVCVDELESTAAAGASGAAAAAQLTAALAAAPDCTWVCSDEFSLRCKVAEMPRLLPLLLGRWHGMKMLQLITPTAECLTPAAVGALRALLEGMPSCTELCIAGLMPHPSIQLLPVLASTNVSTVVLLHTRMTEVQLGMWCSGGQASRPITVELQEACRFSGTISHVRSAVDVPGSGVKLQKWVDEYVDDDDEDDNEWV